MAKIILKDAFYSPFQDVFTGKSARESANDIALELQKHISLIGIERGYSYRSSEHHYLCSTMMDCVFSAESIDVNHLLDNSKQRIPHSFTHAYECACWGYCLQHHFEYRRNQKYLTISIMDINSLEMKYWSASDHWGKSGFGITTLFFEISEDGGSHQLIHTGVARGGNNIIGFASFANQIIKGSQANMLSLPFFPDSMSMPVRRSLKDIELLTERHATYGHSFGSDPWISFIKDHQEMGLADRQILFGSLALRGYYCFADIHIANNVNTGIFE